MARPKEFDEEIVLQKAMMVFWEKGYESTTMQDLVDAMGINRGSLYATFGDKRALYLRALDHFAENQMSAVLAPLSAVGSKRAAIRRIFVEAANSVTSGGDKRGCMMYNAAIEICPGDRDVSARIANGLKRIEFSFHQALLEAWSKGEISKDKDPLALARTLANSLNGLRVMGRIYDDKSMLDDIVNTSLTVLE
ncbi:MAG: TetR/AcrR family transcriptional regulator [Rhodospirillales bacterium]|nr:TetR/AcrR family transcriptional regulator [Rhodospirillales bacterium]